MRGVLGTTRFCQVEPSAKQGKQQQRLSYSAPTVDGDTTTTTTSPGGPTRGASARKISGTRTTSDDPYASATRNGPCPCGSGKKFKRCHGDPTNRDA